MANCTRDVSYWKSHHKLSQNVETQKNWPIPEETVFNCPPQSKTWYQILNFTESDMWTKVASQLIPAFLNEATGAMVPEEVDLAIEMAHDLICFPSNFTGNISQVYQTLVSYNQGLEGSVSCNEPPCCFVSGEAWSDWGPCERKCHGTKKRTQGNCVCPILGNANNVGMCSNQVVQEIECGPIFASEWSSCDKRCGGGVKWRTSENLCDGSAERERTSCNVFECPLPMGELYWKLHNSESQIKQYQIPWPENSEEKHFPCDRYYSLDKSSRTWLQILNSNINSTWYQLAKSYITAYLNKENGARTSREMVRTITRANYLLGKCIRFTSDETSLAFLLIREFNSYNNRKPKENIPKLTENNLKEIAMQSEHQGEFEQSEENEVPNDAVEGLFALTEENNSTENSVSGSQKSLTVMYIVTALVVCALVLLTISATAIITRRYYDNLLRKEPVNNRFKDLSREELSKENESREHFGDVDDLSD